MSEPDRLVSIALAAELAGIPERTVRRWITRGHVPVTSGPRGRLVDPEVVRRAANLAESSRSPSATAGHVAESDRSTPAAAHNVRQPDQDWPNLTGTDVLALLREKDQQLLELAGRCGWLQSELEQARATIRQLQAPNPRRDCAEGSATSYGSSEHQNGPDSSVQKAGSAEIAPERSSDAQNSPVAGEMTHTAPGQQTGAERRPWWRFW